MKHKTHTASITRSWTDQLILVLIAILMVFAFYVGHAFITASLSDDVPVVNNLYTNQLDMFVSQAGSLFSITQIAHASSEQGITSDVDTQAALISGRIAGTVWVDLNRDNIRGLAEPSAKQTYVFMQNVVQDDDVEETMLVLADENGDYVFEFTDLASGQYIIWAGSSNNRVNGRTIFLDDSIQAVSSEFNLPIPGLSVYLPVVAR
ncbi:MAG: hypothetical protein AAF639_07420 [Chloroflexota bacterium]